MTHTTKTRALLPPLTDRRGRQLRWLAAAWTLAAIFALADGIVSGHLLMILSGVGYAFCGGLTIYELRRRSDPSRTAGWGRGR